VNHNPIAETICLKPSASPRFVLQSSRKFVALGPEESKTFEQRLLTEMQWDGMGWDQIRGSEIESLVLFSKRKSSLACTFRHPTSRY
jgi:hypothetical protein